MAIRKTNDISNESNSKYNNVKNAKKVANINERFDDTTHNDNPYDDAIQYLAKKVDDIIDETNTQTTASGSYATDIKRIDTAQQSISGSFSTRVTTNDAKVTSPFPALITTQAKATVEINSITHAAAASDDATDTLNIVVNVTAGGRTTKKTFVLNAS
jgi:hypothetical protein